jgi:hypothetical protein
MIALLQNAVVTATADQLPVARFSSRMSTLVLVISTSLVDNNAHSSGNFVISSTSFEGRFVKIQSFGMEACCLDFFSATSSFQSGVISVQNVWERAYERNEAVEATKYKERGTSKSQRLSCCPSPATRLLARVQKITAELFLLAVIPHHTPSSTLTPREANNSMSSAQKLTKKQKKAIAFRERKQGKGKGKDGEVDVDNDVPIAEDQDMADIHGDDAEVESVGEKEAKQVQAKARDEGRELGFETVVEMPKKRKRDVDGAAEEDDARVEKPKRKKKKGVADDGEAEAEAGAVGKGDKKETQSQLKQRYILFVGMSPKSSPAWLAIHRCAKVI